jgi:pSer/pThr/pTyr-binding forkhead associated (FHA) protein
MITCAVCRNREQEGELYCSECGSRLTGNRPGTGPDSTKTYAAAGRISEMTTPAASQKVAPAAGASAGASLQSGQITLTITGVNQVVVLQGRTEYVLGREGHEQVIPDLNLNNYGARDKGVSRVHAALRCDRGQVFLIDLGSTNGTRLNGQPLPAHQPAPVASGDEIRLGKLFMRISFVP